MTACDLVVFDLDGTVFDSHDVMCQSFRAAFRRARPDCDTVPFEQLQQHQGMPFPDICRMMGWPSELTGFFIEESRSRVGTVLVFPEALELIRFFARAGTPLAVLTGKDRLRSRELLEHSGLEQYFVTMVCGDDPVNGKPEPDGLRHLIDITKSRAAHTYYIGDAVNDWKCAERARVNFVGVQWPEQPRSLPDGGAFPIYHCSRSIIEAVSAAEGIERAGTGRGAQP